MTIPGGRQHCCRRAPAAAPAAPAAPAALYVWVVSLGADGTTTATDEWNIETIRPNIQSLVVAYPAAQYAYSYEWQRHPDNNAVPPMDSVVWTTVQAPLQVPTFGGNPGHLTTVNSSNPFPDGLGEEWLRVIFTQTHTLTGATVVSTWPPVYFVKGVDFQPEHIGGDYESS